MNTHTQIKKALFMNKANLMQSHSDWLRFDFNYCHPHLNICRLNLHEVVACIAQSALYFLYNYIVFSLMECLQTQGPLKINQKCPQRIQESVV